MYTFGDCISYFSNCWDQIHDKMQIERMQIFHGLQVGGMGHHEWESGAVGDADPQ